ncbi:MAG: hypothetical protein ABW133_10175 [Polyangiaceae bacterium]
MTPLSKTLPLAVVLLTALSGCELLNYDAGLEPPAEDGINPDGGAPTGPAPLYPFRPGAVWQYLVTNADGTTNIKTVEIDTKEVMVGGNGPHQNDMAFSVRTSYDGRPPSQVKMQQVVGNQVYNWREQTLDPQSQWIVLLDISWEPQQLEIDQSSDHTRTGATWVDSYLEVQRPLGAVPTTVKLNERWTVMGEEMVKLPTVADRTFQCIVFQKVATTGGTGDGGTTGDAGVVRPMLTAPSYNTAGDAGSAIPNIPKTLWYARGFGKIKEAGGGEPTEELSGLKL